MMFVQISPSIQDIGETVSSLNFASRVRGVELGPAKRQIDMGELQKLKLQVSWSDILYTQCLENIAHLSLSLIVNYNQYFLKLFLFT